MPKPIFMIEETVVLQAESHLFLGTSTLIKGLIFTDDFDQVDKNINVFDIKFDEAQSKKGTQSNVSKKGEHAIITLIFDKRSQAQYLISKTLDLKKLDKVSEQIIPKAFKELIVQAYAMTQTQRTLGDFFKK